MTEVNPISAIRNAQRRIDQANRLNDAVSWFRKNPDVKFELKIAGDPKETYGQAQAMEIVKNIIPANTLQKAREEAEKLLKEILDEL